MDRPAVLNRIKVEPPKAPPPLQTRDQPRFKVINEYEAELKKRYGQFIAKTTTELMDRAAEMIDENYNNL